jgi:hypothetical protein
MDMRNLMIPALILFALAYSCQSLEPIKISQESGMSILANITPAPANQSEINATLNQTNQTQTNNSTNSTDFAASGLWSWGKIPEGYELNENGSLIKMADEEWKPSI